jgi:hypothetical protein
MAQFARPSADTNNPGSYTDEAAGSSDIFNSIDETSASDSDYIQSPATPSSAVYVTKLSTVVDPLSSSGHIVRWRRGKDVGTGGEQIDLTVQLRQDYVNEGTPGTLIAAKTVNDIAQAFADDSMTLSGGEADSITDYSNLYLRLLFNKP